MATLDELLVPFATSIYAKTVALNQLELLPKQRARIQESIDGDIRKCTDFIEPEVSHAAQERAKRLDPAVDLCSMKWQDQPTFDPRRNTFHFEHIVPVSAIRASCFEQNTVTGVFNCLKKRLRVAWILKTENAELTIRGYRSKRANPDAAYHDAKIQLLTCPKRRTRK